MLRATGPETIRNKVRCFGQFKSLDQYINDVSIGNLKVVTKYPYPLKTKPVLPSTLAVYLYLLKASQSCY